MNVVTLRCLPDDSALCDQFKAQFSIGWDEALKAGKV